MKASSALRRFAPLLLAGGPGVGCGTTTAVREGSTPLSVRSESSADLAGESLPSCPLSPREGTVGLGCPEDGVLASVEVAPQGPTAAAGTPMAIELDELTDLPASRLSWIEVRDESCTDVLFQVAGDDARTLHWLLEPRASGEEARRFVLVESGEAASSAVMNLRDNGEVLMLRAEQRELLGYHYGLMPAPPGQNPLYARSGFIHPLLSPHGRVLTRIQPEDHYHHYGLWDAWTHVKFEGREIDFWNLTAGQGTVRFAGFASRDEGPVFAGYTARQNHVVFEPGGGETLALEERQTVRVYRSLSPDAYVADITMTMEAPQSQFLILAHRYAGLGFRAASAWHGDNSTVLTSAGRTRSEADNTTARWWMVQGDIEGNRAGLVMMSHPENLSHPEPLRVWTEDQHAGSVYAMFAPTRVTDWALEPGQTYQLRYRMYVFDGELDAAGAERAWSSFGAPPKVEIQKR